MSGEPTLSTLYLHREGCRCASCDAERDPVGPWRRTLFAAVCLLLIFAGVVTRL